MRTYDLDFQGYFLVPSFKKLPEDSGIYIFYRCKYNKQENKVELIEILYIGQAEDIKDRINRHDKYPDFDDYLKPGEELCLSYAKLSTNDLDRVENALVYTQKPPFNELLKDHFNYNDTTLNVKGSSLLIKKGEWLGDNNKIIIIN